MVYVVVRTSCDYEGTYYEGIEAVYESKEEAVKFARMKEKKNVHGYVYEVEEVEFIERR